VPQQEGRGGKRTPSSEATPRGSHDTMSRFRGWAAIEGEFTIADSFNLPHPRSAASLCLEPSRREGRGREATKDLSA
jgi:hypothetical protein